MVIQHLGQRIEDEATIRIMEEQMIEGLLTFPDLRMYEQSNIISQIFLSQDILASITMTELENKVEVIRRDLDYNPLRFFLYDIDLVYGLGYYLGLRNERRPELPRVVRFGTMPKEEYLRLFNFLEQNGVWDIQNYKNEFDGSSNTLFISRNQRKHAFQRDMIYNLRYLESMLSLRRTNRELVAKTLPSYMTPEERDDSLRFLDISKKIYSVSKRYAKNLIVVS